MLIQVSIKNFKTFKDSATLSLIASNYDNKTRMDDNLIIQDKVNYKLLKSAVIYGANASGKSKLIDAIAFMRYIVINSSKQTQNGESIPVEPFRLDKDSDNEPTEFEAIFIYDNEQFRYGFETTKHKIIAEWLYHKPKTKEVELFYRDEDGFNIHPKRFSKGAMVEREGLLRDNALFVSVAAQFNENLAISVVDWFKKLRIISGIHEFGYQGYTMGKTQDEIHKEKIIELINAADLGIQDINLKKLDLNSLPKDMSKEDKERITKGVLEENAQYATDVLTTRNKYDSEKNIIGIESFSLEEDESSGTQKFFALAGPILDVLENGYTLIVDELDSKLHPNLVCKIVELFNSKVTNSKNAQLIFNTHNTNLLSSKLFRRDQIWFVNKNKYGEANLYSLADFSSAEVKINDPFEDFYIQGKYGAVPYLGFFYDLDNTLCDYETKE